MPVTALDAAQIWAGTAEYNESYSISAGTDRALICALMDNWDQATYTPTLTYGGQSLTQFGSSLVSAANAGGRGKIAAFGLNDAGIAAASGSNLVSTNAVNNSGDTHMIARTYQGCGDQTNIIDTAATQTDTDSTASVSATLSSLHADHVGVAFLHLYASNATTGGANITNNFTELTGNLSNSSYGAAAIGDTITHSTGNQIADGDSGASHNAIAMMLLEIPDTGAAVTPEIEQEGFRIRNDDGSESAATWKAAQDVNTTVEPNEVFRLRFVSDFTGDVTAFLPQLESKLSTQATYRKTPLE